MMKRRSDFRAKAYSIVLNHFLAAVPTVSAALLFAFTCRTQTLGPTDGAAQAILEHNCFGCHGKARVSGLDLRQRETLLKGGKRGPAVIPGKAQESLLYRAVIQDGELKMPPSGAPLAKADLETLRKWIEEGAIWDEDVKGPEPKWWSLRNPKRPPVPAVKASSWVRTPIDAFILAKLEEMGLNPAPPASKLTLVRRAYFDLIGLPPTPEQVRSVLEDRAPNAYEKLIDQLLASPQYGERWGRHWLDVVRYADSSGFEGDLYYPNAWRYRDYVIHSFNDDKPYNQFVQEQIAGDELWPDDLTLEGSYIVPERKHIDLERRIGTGLYTIGPADPSSGLNEQQASYERLADMADTTGSAFLGLTIGCARCHDHKFDPITQKDYYRLQAIFAGSEEKEIPVVDTMKVKDYRKAMPELLKLEDLRREFERLEKQRGKRDENELKAEERRQRDELLARIGKAYVHAPRHYETASVLGHSEIVPDVHIAARGDFRKKLEKVGPGFPAVLSDGKEIQEPENRPFVPQRRKALALWLTKPDHPLTARVIVNRIWAWHFGRGIVATPNDFGRQGELPTHPELLDWLAADFVARGWSIKAMHRAIMLSSAYQMSSESNEANAKVDVDNHYVWRMSRQRLEAEELRDAVLFCAGDLNMKMGGSPVIPPLNNEELAALEDEAQWPATSDPAEPLRRSVYLFSKRTFRMPFLETFDMPDNSLSCARREATTVAPQALALLNNKYILGQARVFAERLKHDFGNEPKAWIDHAWEIALGRRPAEEEERKALEMFRNSSPEELSRFCLMVFNLNEFLYVD
jgi:hypothetical protein